MAVHQEGIAMMAVAQLHREKPRAVGRLLHWIRGWIPLIEISDEADRLSLGRVTDKVHRPQSTVCPVASGVHTQLDILPFETSRQASIGLVIADSTHDMLENNHGALANLLGLGFERAIFLAPIAPGRVALAPDGFQDALSAFHLLHGRSQGFAALGQV